MHILEDGGHPYGVLPGNHDNTWGRSNDLYNEYFPPSRFESQPTYGGSWREDDSQNRFDVLEVGGAKFLMIALGYSPAADEAIEWAQGVIDSHPDHNVIFATHEYIFPADGAGEVTGRSGAIVSPENSRWTSRGQRYWDELILPNEQVFLTLSGHHHGVALNIKRTSAASRAARWWR